MYKVAQNDLIFVDQLLYNSELYLIADQKRENEL